MKKFSCDNIVAYKPASFSGSLWNEASLTGNGKIGAMIRGGIAEDGIILNHIDLRHGGHTGVLQDVSDKLKEVRKLYADNKILEAGTLLEKEFQKKNCNPKPDTLLPLCELKLNFEVSGAVRDYRRITNMATSELKTSFVAGDMEWERSLILSRSSDIMAFEVKNATKTAVGAQKVNLSLSFSHFATATLGTTVKYEGGFIYFASKGVSGDFGVVVKVQTVGGNATTTADEIYVKGADSVLILAKPFIGEARDVAFRTIREEFLNLKGGYSKFALTAATAHKKLYDKVSLNLKANDDEDDMQSVLKTALSGETSANLLNRLFNFGKYLAVCGGEGLLTPAGIWQSNPNAENGNLKLSKNMPLIYGSVMASLNEDYILKLLDEYEKYSGDLKKNALRVYSASGYFVTDEFQSGSVLIGRTDSKTIHFVAVGAIVVNLFYNYYKISGDAKILKSRIFPFMKDVFAFYSDLLKLGGDGYYQTVPSVSGDSVIGNAIGGKVRADFHFASNSAIDFIAIKELLNNLIEASQVINVSGEAVWRDMLSRFPEFEVAGDGALKEYIRTPFITNEKTQGFCLGYGLFPIKNFIGDEALENASAVAVSKRILTAGAFQETQDILIAAEQLAHAGDAEKTQELIARIASFAMTDTGVCLAGDFVGNGLIKKSEPSPDFIANIGLSNLIADSIIQSAKGKLKILPLGISGLEVGEISNVATTIGALVTANWDANKGKLYVKITPKASQKIDIYLPNFVKKVKDKTQNLENGVIKNVALIASKTYIIEA
ncbi:MAG: glycoside hydrolase family 95 protein [Christensenellaceae bacterium]|jgi:alpha-L-fucosidase 2|nr:glycoside hydrolase family 95 protein [Christensenellaceae bacterium]